MYFVKRTIVFIFLLINASQNLSFAADSPPLPVVLWHGMGDSCCFSFSLGAIKKILENEIPGVEVISIRIGRDTAEDVMNGFFKNANHQIEEVCNLFSNEESLKNGYNAIGFSQGSQFLRAVAQRCPYPQMKNLISIGGQHQGVYGLPRCPSLDHGLCNRLRKILNHAAYYKFVQNNFVQAEYWHDPLQEDDYKKYSIFLADINNERTLNQTYKDNLQKLKKFVLIKFTEDSMVQPHETEWFGFYKPGQSEKTQSLQESDLYKEDRLGLKKMDEDGKIDFLQVHGDHLQFTADWFIENIIRKYLN
ncbi:palmitoyl-protein thioesterase 1 [Leptopilina boulardi]|uniref:palmitoyl-protein thioesterase 1 n=1 Tax=Leptopilina boulardi TaxID=63433 RepID=UPI0021F5EC92|nr:palmitoyl-protein thioesterase 1 [Leptopilina boulardi]